MAQMNHVANMVGQRHVPKGTPIDGKVLRQRITELGNKGLAGGCDWTARLAPGVYQLCGCGLCDIYPVVSCSWWRVVRCDDAAGQTAQSGHWRCANCCGRWEWAKYGHMQLLIVGDEGGFFFAHLGKVSMEIINKTKVYKEMQTHRGYQ